MVRAFHPDLDGLHLTRRQSARTDGSLQLHTQYAVAKALGALNLEFNKEILKSSRIDEIVKELRTAYGVREEGSDTKIERVRTSAVKVSPSTIFGTGNHPRRHAH